MLQPDWVFLSHNGRSVFRWNIANDFNSIVLIKRFMWGLLDISLDGPAYL